MLDIEETTSFSGLRKGSPKRENELGKGKRAIWKGQSGEREDALQTKKFFGRGWSWDLWRPWPGPQEATSMLQRGSACWEKCTLATLPAAPAPLRLAASSHKFWGWADFGHTWLQESCWPSSQTELLRFLGYRQAAHLTSQAQGPGRPGCG